MSVRSVETGVAQRDSKARDQVEGRQWWILGAALIFFVWFYYFTCSHLIEQTNQNRYGADQGVHIQLARETVRDVWPLRTDGVVNPLWPWIARSVAVNDDQQFFVRGKWLNVAIVGVFLVGLAVVSARFLPLFPTLNLLFIAALGAFIPRAVYFQPEPLFYIFFFVTWLCFWRLLVRNPIWLYAVAGVLAGFTYLAKASTTPLLIVFLAVSSLRFFSVCWPRLFPFLAEDKRWSPRSHLAGLVLLAVGFGAVIAPRAVYANERFGDPFHNFPSYFMWLDDMEREVKPWGQKFSSKEALARLSPSERPSLKNYLRSHTWGDFFDRLHKGTSFRLKRFFFPDGKVTPKSLFSIRSPEKVQRWKHLLIHRGLYIILPLFLTGALVVVAKNSGVSLRAYPELWVVGLFVLGTFVIYSLGYGWYNPIARGDRFMLSLYLPSAFTFIWAAERLKRVAGSPLAYRIYGGTHIFIAALLLVRIINIVVTPKF